MRINKYVRQWYDEDYSPQREEFYIENARWTVAKCWKDGATKHGRVVGVITALYFLWNGANMLVLGDALFLLAVLTTAFFFYGIREYGLNDAVGSVAIYILTIIFVLWSKQRMPLFLYWIFSAMGVILYVYLTFIFPRRALKQKRRFEEKLGDVEKEEEECDKQTYAKWEYEYNSYRNATVNEEMQREDESMQRARQLFQGYDISKELLRNRYRQLAKDYHPDNGGDEHLFQCISAVYEELQKT